MSDNAIKVLFITAEAAPFIKVGGLGDVAGTLPEELRRAGVDIRVAIPLHHQIDRSKYDLKPAGSVAVPRASETIPAQVYRTDLGDMPVYLFDSPLLPSEGSLYATDPRLDAPKFVHFSLAALAFAIQLDWKPDVIHAQDWHTAISVYALSLLRGRDPYFSTMASLLTVHNLPYHGVGTEGVLASFGLPPAERSPLPWWAQHLPLPLGLLAADHINTVSPGYAAEMLTEPFGAGLDGYLKAYKSEALSGILNGLDMEAWDPRTDPAITAHYDEHNLDGKDINKVALQRELGLPEQPDTMLFGIVSRMDQQKGIDLALDGLRLIAGQPWQAVVLGTGQPAIEESARQLQQELPAQVRVMIDFDAQLGRRIYAGADAFLIPSRYEPCGLTQMISMRYGTIPVARAVGGLKDTIQDYGNSKSGNGFLFEAALPEGMADALQRALAVYEDGRRWRGLQRRGMKQDFSWEKSAQDYVSLYRRIIRERHQSGSGEAGPE
jgi:starch synthase